MPRLVFLLLFLFPFTTFSQEESVDDLFSFYQKFISDTRGTTCPMFPSCSEYAISSFRNEGALMGFLNTSDRLMRCGHEHHLYDLGFIDGSYKLIDTVTEEEKTRVKNETQSKQFSKTYHFSKERNDTTFFLKLIDLGMYEQAVTEYHRIKHFDQNAPPSLTLEFNHLRALYGLGEYEKIIYHYEREIPEVLKKKFDINLKVSHAWYQLGGNEQAIKQIKNYHPTHPDDANEFLAYIHAMGDDYNISKDYYSKINAEYRYYDYVRNNQSVLLEIENFQPKRPLLAGLFSIVPGGGYFYAEQKTTAIASLLLNGLLGYATYSNLKNDNYGMAALTGVFSASFYIGNITGGIRSAKRYNESKINLLKQQLRYSFN